MISRQPTLQSDAVLDLERVERVAIFRALHLGDFLCSVPALRALDRRFPEAEITLIGLPWLRRVISRYPYVDRFLEFPGYWGLEDMPWDTARTRAFFEESAAYHYDVAIQMHGDGRISNRFVSELAAGTTVGRARPGNDQELHLELDWPSEEVHEILRCLDLVGALGASGTPDLEFPLRADDFEEAERVALNAGVDLGRPFILLHPGASDPARRWPPASFASAAREIARSTGAQIIVTGTNEELPVACEVAERMHSRAYVLAGKTQIGALAALLSRSLLFITNDTGPSHLAAAVRARSVVLFGPTEPARWAPLDRSRHTVIIPDGGREISRIPAEVVVAESTKLVGR